MIVQWHAKQVAWEAGTEDRERLALLLCAQAAKEAWGASRLAERIAGILRSDGKSPPLAGSALNQLANEAMDVNAQAYRAATEAEAALHVLRGGELT